MNGDVAEGHAEWAPLERDRDEIPGQPSVIVLPVPRPYRKRLAKEAVAQSLPEAIAAFVAWLLKESGWGYRERDVAVLFRKRNYNRVDLTRELVRGLEARAVPHLLAGSKSFHRREEVETLRSALTAVEWPDDELSVFAALKGSLFAIPDEALLLYRHQHGRLSPFAKREVAPSTDIERALDLLAGLHRKRNQRPFATTVNILLDAVRAHAGFVLRPGGQQILANVARVADMARTFEMSGGISFRSFVEELATQSEREDAAEAPVLEEDSDGVRIMTVHSAKGLEFPVVILADLTTGLSRNAPERHVDGERKLCAVELLGCAPQELLDCAAEEARRERAEGIRVAYVAATRARDLLVIPAVGDEAFPTDSWLSPLYKAIYPARAQWRKSRPAPGCPVFGAASVVERSSEYDQAEEYSVRPGLIQPETGSHEVVWWDPFKLNLSGEPAQTPDQILATRLHDDGGVSLAAYRAWQQEREALLQRGARPEVEVFLASQAAEAPAGAAIAVEYLSAAAAPRAVSGKRFGTLVHGVLRDVALDADSAAVRRLAEMNARVLGAPAEEAGAAHAAVVAVLAHAVLERARGAERRHREYPLTLAMPDRRVMEGVIDLAFVEDGGWVVVDFKTDADSAERRAQYERQLQWYAHALAELTGMRARGILLGV